jgi:ABC-type bacteriocin/lantibiotic exporter with double-glycine peptidase domain
MHGLRWALIVSLLLGCRSRGGESDPHAVAKPSPEPTSTALAPTTPHGNAELILVRQSDDSECGPAALATTLTYYGRPTTLDASKAATHYNSAGTTALDLVNAALASGLGATGIAVDSDAGLPVLRTGDILHFDFSHFVVFDAFIGDSVQIMDPADGSHRLDRATFASHFTGVALLFERSPAALETRLRSIGIAPGPAQ